MVAPQVSIGTQYSHKWKGVNRSLYYNIVFCTILYYMYFKGISQDFKVCFLVPLDRIDIATPDGTGSFKKKMSISCQIFNYSGLCSSSFRCEQISAQGATAAHFVAPVRELQRKVTQIWLQHNNKYSFDREQPGLILNFW
jgi:hypothetical protein